MAGVWVFRNGVVRLAEKQEVESLKGSQKGSNAKGKVLVYLPTGEVITSYAALQRQLSSLGWERYYGGEPDLLQFHKTSTVDLISLPKDFNKFNSLHMYDVVIKNPNMFHVRDM